MSDIEIARAANKKPIQEIGAKLGIPTEHLLPFVHQISGGEQGRPPDPRDCDQSDTCG